MVAATMRGNASSASSRPARAKAAPSTSRILAAPGGSPRSPPPPCPNLPFTRISLYSLVAAMNCSSSGPDSRPPLPSRAPVTAEYIAVFTAAAGQGCARSPSSRGQRSAREATTAFRTVSARRFASIHAFWRSRMGAAFSGSRVRKRKLPKGSSNETGRPEHSGSSYTRRRTATSPTHTWHVGPARRAKSGPYSARSSASSSGSGLCVSRAQSTRGAPRKGSAQGPGSSVKTAALSDALRRAGAPALPRREGAEAPRGRAGR
mmetsp:Transcript_34251/g.102349  ORF Transcript_34251/g.102349 Transcript_34251/m.102349 type:complete len:262 (+) Transcript_34251:754-1539(+)